MVEFEVPIGKQVYTPDGSRINAEYEDPAVARRDKVIPGDTEDHEANHAGVAEKTGSRVIRIRIGRRGNVLADTLVDRPNGLAAAVTIGRDGDYGDRNIVRSMGLPEASTAAAARGIASGIQDEITEIAKAVTVTGELSGTEVREAMKDGKEGRKVVISFRDRNGRNQQEVRTRVKGPVAMVPRVEYALAQAA